MYVTSLKVVATIEALQFFGGVGVLVSPEHSFRDSHLKIRRFWYEDGWHPQYGPQAQICNNWGEHSSMFYAMLEVHQN